MRALGAWSSRRDRRARRGKLGWLSSPRTGGGKESQLEDWLFSHAWTKSDNSPIGVAMRLMYVLDYSVPGDWTQIIEGRAQPDYMENGFLWDRIGLAPPGWE